VKRPNRPAELEDDLENQLSRGSLWAIGYGGLMSYLCVFFMLLYVAAVTRGTGIQMGANAADLRFAGEAKTIQQMFTRYGTQKIARLEIGENKVRIVFLAPVLFDPGQAVLRKESLPILQDVVKTLEGLPNAIQIEGHTDDRALGSSSRFESNWELSAARAFAVLRFLEISGIAQQRLSAIGYGEFRPMETNATPEGRQVNRRVEMNIIRRELN
jgi:flagellar motor protein MotB